MYAMPISLTLDGKKAMGKPSESLHANPLAMPHIPRVAIKGGTLNLVIRTPLISPGISPRRMPTEEPARMLTA